MSTIPVTMMPKPTMTTMSEQTPMVQTMSANLCKQVMAELMEESVCQAKQIGLSTGGVISAEVESNNATAIYVALIQVTASIHQNNLGRRQKQVHHEENIERQDIAQDFFDSVQLRAAFVKARSQLFGIWSAAMWTQLAIVVWYGMYGDPEKSTFDFPSEMLGGILDVVVGTCPARTVVQVAAPPVAASYWQTGYSYLVSAAAIEPGSILEPVSMMDWLRDTYAWWCHCYPHHFGYALKFTVIAYVALQFAKPHLGEGVLNQVAIGFAAVAWLRASAYAYLSWYFLMNALVGVFTIYKLSNAFVRLEAEEAKLTAKMRELATVSRFGFRMAVISVGVLLVTIGGMSAWNHHYE
jgi:hypothetical protein